MVTHAGTHELLSLIHIYNRPKTLAMMDAINFYIEHRREVVVRRTRYLLGDAEKDAAVSYTHLDVYKRQCILLVMKE